MRKRQGNQNRTARARDVPAGSSARSRARQGNRGQGNQKAPLGRSRPPPGPAQAADTLRPGSDEYANLGSTKEYSPESRRARSRPDRTGDTGKASADPGWGPVSRDRSASTSVGQPPGRAASMGKRTRRAESLLAQAPPPTRFLAKRSSFEFHATHGPIRVSTSSIRHRGSSSQPTPRLLYP